VRTAPTHRPTHAHTHARTRTHTTQELRLAACRCTDHRLGSNFALDGVLGGQIEPIVGACIAMDQQEQLEEMQAE
jgi:protein subunit release factor A